MAGLQYELMEFLFESISLLIYLNFFRQFRKDKLEFVKAKAIIKPSEKLHFFPHKSLVTRILYDK
ncbi:hypothetical protein BpHYR1_000151 [Brachionus plicatilis]|uniref:Uncharacterized protein n=1 Tax=Brachionus plicatilis TaxID=10195 RepID=A0A3M7SCW7_BRAPC|nr:hypothetical protein BpHYR1_000151 [Brachionus plicatilis]